MGQAKSPDPGRWDAIPETTVIGSFFMEAFLSVNSRGYENRVICNITPFPRCASLREKSGKNMAARSACGVLPSSRSANYHGAVNVDHLERSLM
ncbi:hypothetical protein [Martelella alba]|uniref:hypothetical protein n=1 Tax=Martelella alba TaxID=2590451 RepID=UPI0011325EEC|nr:hypothetical protein [Martelella alba]